MPVSRFLTKIQCNFCSAFVQNTVVGHFRDLAGCGTCGKKKRDCHSQERGGWKVGNANERALLMFLLRFNIISFGIRLVGTFYTHNVCLQMCIK